MEITFKKGQISDEKTYLLVNTHKQQKAIEDIDKMIESQFLQKIEDNGEYAFTPSMEMLETLYLYFKEKEYTINITKTMEKALETAGVFKIKKSTIEQAIDKSKIHRKTKKEKEQNYIEEKEVKNHVTLSRLFNRINQIVRSEFQENIWLQCEIANINFSNKGHIYMDLVETDSNGNEVAKNKAIIWSNISQKVINKFQIGTGSELSSGQKVLLNISVTFDQRFGLNLAVKDIDPSFTLGDMELKIKNIREQLKKEDLYTINHQKLLPFMYTRVAVISPNEAAGLKDFQIEADKLQAAELCQFDYYPALFQGKQSSSSIIKAINKVIEKETEYDALVVIRGGGAKTDLHYLNDFDIAKKLTQTKLPVLIGIGHEVDHGILDEIGTEVRSTPSKVIEMIVNNINEKINTYIDYHNDVKNSLMYLLENTEYKLTTGIDKLKTIIFESVYKYENKVKEVHDYNRNTLLNNIEMIEKKTQENKQLIQTEFINILIDIENNVKLLNQENQSNILHNINSLQSNVMETFYEMQTLNPKALFEKGFNVAMTIDKKPIKSVKNANINDNMTLYLIDGKINAIIQEIENAENK